MRLEMFDTVAKKSDKGKSDCNVAVYYFDMTFKCDLSDFFIFFILGSNPQYKPEVVTYPNADFGKQMLILFNFYTFVTC